MLFGSTQVARSALTLLQLSGVHRLLAAKTAGIGAILAFHRVLPRSPVADFEPNASLSITPEFLASSIELVQRRGYEIVPLAEARRRILAGGSKRRFCCFTFDDGYRDNLFHALPIAERYGVPITIFVTTGFVMRRAAVWWLALEFLVRSQDEVTIGTGFARQCLPTTNRSEKEKTYHQLAGLLARTAPAEQAVLLDRWAQRYGVDCRALAAEEILTWPEVEELDRSGLVEIGSHADCHKPLSGMSEPAAREEMTESRRILGTKLGRPIEFLAYPFGRLVHAGTREYELAAEVGYSGAVTMRHGTIHPEHGAALYALPRLTMNGVYASLRALDLFLSGTTAALLPAAAR